LILKGKDVIVLLLEDLTASSRSSKGGEAMAVEVIQCPPCQSKAVVRYGTASNGKAVLVSAAREGRTFMGAYAYPERVPAVKQMNKVSLGLAVTFLDLP